MRVNMKYDPSRQAGFSLLEVLITIVIVALGLLGVAGMQVTSMRLTEMTENRSMGSIFANDIIDRIRSNRANALAYDINFGGPPSSVTDLASQDLLDWKTLLSHPRLGLPGGDGSVDVVADPTCPAVAPARSCFQVTVTLQWNEGRQRGEVTTPKQFLRVVTRV
jgi:type IV pilus assembly protein PilV